MRGGLRRARPQLKGPLALAGAIALAACSRSADAVPAPASASPQADAGPAATARPAADGRDGTAPGPGARGAAAPAAAIGETTCTAAPLGVQVGSIRREAGDRLRVELTLSHLGPADGWSPVSADGKALQAAVDALAGASVLSADGRRRLFALRDAAGDRVGSPLTAPAPGRPQTVWTQFPAAEGRVSLLLPGCEPVGGLAVTPRPGPPEP